MNRQNVVAFATIVVALPVLVNGVGWFHDGKTKDMKLAIATAEVPFLNHLAEVHESEGMIKCETCDECWDNLNLKFTEASIYWGESLNELLKEAQEEWKEYKTIAGDVKPKNERERVRRDEYYREFLKALRELREATRGQREWFRL